MFALREPLISDGSDHGRKQLTRQIEPYAPYPGSVRPPALTFHQTSELTDKQNCLLSCSCKMQGMTSSPVQPSFFLQLAFDNLPIFLFPWPTPPSPYPIAPTSSLGCRQFWRISMTMTPFLARSFPRPPQRWRRRQLRQRQAPVEQKRPCQTPDASVLTQKAANTVRERTRPCGTPSSIGGCRGWLVAAGAYCADHAGRSSRGELTGQEEPLLVGARPCRIES